MQIDKSLLTNLIALSVVVVAFALPVPWQGHVLTVGLFALSGGVTNWLAVHMLFERVPGFYGSGVIPLHFESFKRGIRQVIMQQFFSAENIDRYFMNAALMSGQLDRALHDVVEQMDLDKAFDSLVEAIMESSLGSMLGMFGGRDALEKLREPFRTRIREHLLGLLESERFHQSLREQLSGMISVSDLAAKIESMVDSRLEELTPQMVKEIVQGMIREHLGWLVIWGAVIGGVIGLLFSSLGQLFL